MLRRPAVHDPDQDTRSIHPARQLEFVSPALPVHEPNHMPSILIWPAKKRPPTALEEPMMLNTQRKVAAFSLEATFSSCQKGKTMAV